MCPYGFFWLEKLIDEEIHRIEIVSVSWRFCTKSIENMRIKLGGKCYFVLHQVRLVRLSVHREGVLFGRRNAVKL